MKKYYSLIACIIICAFLSLHRATHIGPHNNGKLKQTDWDAFGYYMYLPSILIYKDYKQLNWLPSLEEQYKLLGAGQLYQATNAKNGNYVYKYLGGVALLQLPFFLIAHYMAPSLGYPADGFSAPYQYAVAFAALVYAFLGIFLLRRLMKKYYSDVAVAITLLLLCLASNLPQYAAVDGGQSHIYIFPLYAVVLYTTGKWHNSPTALWAILTGYIIGLATICRPTEAVMLFIPLLWGTHTKEAARLKWAMVKKYKPHIAFTISGGIIGILPQLLYWKSAAGTWIFDVGSAWDFLTPHFRVLFGWEKGWFIYTPVSIFFVVGLFFIKKYPFRKSLMWFCLLNIYIVIAWRDWQYGGSYSTRALVQSYPVFALALGAFVQHIQTGKYRWIMYLAGIYLIAVNIFQLQQYADTILHYRDMNRKYYGAIYLDRKPTPADMSLLDNDELLKDEKGYKVKSITSLQQKIDFNFPAAQPGILADTALNTGGNGENWVKIKAIINTGEGFWQGYLHCDLQSGDSVKHARIRLFSPINKPDTFNEYVLYTTVPSFFKNARIRVYLARDEGNLAGTVSSVNVELLSR